MSEHQTLKRKARIRYMRDLGEHQLSGEDLKQYYPIVPKTIRGTIFMLHPLRYLPPAEDFFFLPYLDTIWPEAALIENAIAFTASPSTASASSGTVRILAAAAPRDTLLW